MKIEKVIFTIDDNPHYKSFWFSISKHFKTKLGFDSKLFIIGSNEDISTYNTEYGQTEFVRKVDGVPTIIQALIGKFYFTKTEPNTTWMVGDLDLYPLQKYHFINSILEVPDDRYVHLNPHAYTSNWRKTIHGLAGYYHVGKGSIIETELKFNDKTFSDVVHEIYKSNRWGIKFHNLGASNESKMASKDYGWFCCEEMYTGELLGNSKALLEIPPINNEYNRMDRTRFDFNFERVSKGHYIDFHAPRPYENYSKEIEMILDMVPTL